MAVIELNYRSTELSRNISFKVILPVEYNLHDKEKKYKTLYLLHGYSGNLNDWLYNTQILKYAKLHNIAVVLPSAENSFYQNYHGEDLKFGSFIANELVEVTRMIFPLSSRKEDTFIGGLSMGAFGSMLLGSQYYETFGAIICLSGAYLVCDLQLQEEVSGTKSTIGEYRIGGKNDRGFQLLNAFDTAKEIQREGNLPPIYMACGTEDFLYDTNIIVSRELSKLGADLTWEQGSGGHDWEFWDLFIGRALDWLFRK